MTDSMNHEYVNSSWTRPCLAISLWGILFRNQTTLYQSLLGILWLPFMSGAWVWVSTKKKKKKSVKDKEMWLSGDQSYTHIVNWEVKTARKYFLKFYLKSPFRPLPTFPRLQSFEYHHHIFVVVSYHLYYDLLLHLINWLAFKSLCFKH